MKSIKAFFCCDQKISAFSIVIFLTVLVGALFVRLYGLSEYAFNDDELWHLTVANQKNLWDVIQYNFQEEIHPPLSYIIWHLMLQISDNDLWLRMSGIIPGILLIPSIYLFGRLYIGKAAGFFLALLFAFGAVPVTISTTIRAYSLMMLALTWAAIFVHKYRFETEVKSRNKSLIFYSLFTFIAIELNHAACFAIFALGLILIFQTLKEKNKKDFFIIAAIHVTLAFLVAAYAYILNTYYGFHGLSGFFTVTGWSEYCTRYLMMTLRFFIGDGAKDSITSAISLLSFIAFITTPISLIRAKKWTLLHLMLTPLLVVIFCDHFNLYPLSQNFRNNLFLFFGIAITCAYFVQILANFFSKIFEKDLKNLSENKKQILIFLQKSSALAIVILILNYEINHNYLRNVMQSCIEFSIKKSDRELLNQKLNQANKDSNVFVTVIRNLWYWRAQNPDKSHITILTKHLGKFENDNITIYFTAFPAIEFSVTSGMIDYQLFLKDLFTHLEAEGNLSKIKSLTFFDLGLKVDSLSKALHPQLIEIEKEPFSTNKDEILYELWKEGYDFGWAINTSKQVLDKFYFRDVKFDCGREIVLLSFTPEFVKNEIINKNFIDWRKLNNDQ